MLTAQNPPDFIRSLMREWPKQLGVLPVQGPSHPEDNAFFGIRKAVWTSDPVTPKAGQADTGKNSSLLLLYLTDLARSGSLKTKRN